MLSTCMTSRIALVQTPVCLYHVSLPQHRCVTTSVKGAITTAAASFGACRVQPVPGRPAVRLSTVGVAVVPARSIDPVVPLIGDQ